MIPGRKSGRHHSLLARPGERTQRLVCQGDVMDVARAAAAAAACRVPVDVAVWVCAEAGALPDGLSMDEALAATVQLTPAFEERMAGWVAQLRHGCVWTEDSLPAVWIPVRVSSDLTPAALDAAVRTAGECSPLRALLDLECAAAAAGLSLTGAVEALRRRAAAPAARRAGGRVR